MRPLDTSPEAYKIQLEIFRAMTPEQRLQLAIDLAQTCRKLLFEGVHQRHPEYKAEDIKLAVIRLQIGGELFCKAYPHARHILP